MTTHTAATVTVVRRSPVLQALRIVGPGTLASITALDPALRVTAAAQPRPGHTFEVSDTTRAQTGDWGHWWVGQPGTGTWEVVSDATFRATYHRAPTT